MKKKRIVYLGAKGKFASKAKAKYVVSAGKKYELPRAKKEREKVIARAKKRAIKPTFGEKISAQGVRKASSQATHARYLTEYKTIHRPGKKHETFDIQKNTFELKLPRKITPKTIKKRIAALKKNAYKKFLKTWEANKGKNFLFRIDTAYVDEKGEFNKVDGVNKKDKSGLSDGRGYSMGRYLEITDKKKFLAYLNDSFYGFAKAYETYQARNGINFGQINALILEVS